jgi:hypothetical protein
MLDLNIKPKTIKKSLRQQAQEKIFLTLILNIKDFLDMTPKV